MTSCMGATLSLLITFVTIAYAWTRFNLLLEFGDTTFQETQNLRGGHSESEVYGQADTNFNVAFAIRPLFSDSSVISEDYLKFNVGMETDGDNMGLKYH